MALTSASTLPLLTLPLSLPLPFPISSPLGQDDVGLVRLVRLVLAVATAHAATHQQAGAGRVGREGRFRRNGRPLGQDGRRIVGILIGGIGTSRTSSTSKSCDGTPRTLLVVVVVVVVVATTCKAQFGDASSLAQPPPADPVGIPRRRRGHPFERRLVLGDGRSRP
jgi:hypothetical protein